VSATTLAGQVQVLCELLEAAAEEIADIEPGGDTHAKALAVLLARINDAVAAVRSPGVDIDSIHFRLTGD
jgi:hypothetical protein